MTSSPAPASRTPTAAPPAPAPRRPLALWIDGWIDPVSAARVRSDLEHVDLIYPVIWNVAPSGEVVESLGEPLRALLAAAKARGVRVLPTIQNLAPSGFEAGLVRPHLERPDPHVRRLVELARRFDGVNLDYESFAPADRPKLSAFLATLGAALRAEGRALSVCVPARTAAEPGWDAALAFDWDRLAKVADEVVVMAYDHAWPTSPPGPVAPVGWWRAVLDYAASKVPPAKLRMGLGAYGYDWGGERTQNVPTRDAGRLSAATGATWQLIPPGTRIGELEVGLAGFLRYRDEKGRERTVWLESPHAMLEKVESLRGRAGLAVWRADYLDDGFAARLAR